MKRCLPILLFFTFCVLAFGINFDILNENLEVLRQVRYAGWIAESDWVSQNYVTGILISRGTDEPIDRVRCFMAYMDYLRLRNLQIALVDKYNSIVLQFELGGIKIPEYLPRRILLDIDSWAMTSQY